MKSSIQVLLVVTANLLGSAPGLAQDWVSNQPVTARERTLLAPTTAMLELGRSVAQTACAACHGMDGAPVGENQPYLAGQRSIYLYRVLQAYRKNGGMRGSTQHVGGFLGDEAMLSVSAYYANQVRVPGPNPPDVTEAPPVLGENPFTGISDSLGKCTKCHDDTGNSSASGMPNLTAQDPEYFVTSMLAYVDGSRNHKLMKKLVGNLDESTIAEMGVYYAVQNPLRTETLGEGDVHAGGRAAEACADCHGSDGNATGSDMPTLAGQDARYFIKAMQAYKDGGRPHEKMFEAVDGLSEAEIIDMASFYASQEPVRRSVRTPFSTTEWIERCERCHGVEGNSTDPRFPMLAGQDEGYLRLALQAYATGSRNSSMMRAMSEPLSEADVGQIVNYYATREPKSVVYLQLPCEGAGAE